MTHRKNLGLGLGKGYKNLIPKDPFVHRMSAKGVKQYVKAPYSPRAEIYTLNKLGSPLFEKKKGKMVEVDYDPYEHPKTMSAKGKAVRIDDIYKDSEGNIFRVDEVHSGFVWLRNIKGDLKQIGKEEIKFYKRLNAKGKKHNTEDEHLNLISHRYYGKPYDSLSKAQQEDVELLEEEDADISMYAKKKLNIWQRIGWQDKPKRGRPEKEYKTQILSGWNIDPQELNRRNIRRIMKTKENKFPYTKREKVIGFGTLAGAGAGYSLGLLAGGLGGMFIGVPAGILAGNIIARNVTKERGRKPIMKFSLAQRLLNPREDLLAKRLRVNAIERARMKTAKLYGLEAKGKKKNSMWRLVPDFMG